MFDGLILFIHALKETLFTQETTQRFGLAAKWVPYLIVARTFPLATLWRTGKRAIRATLTERRLQMKAMKQGGLLALTVGLMLFFTSCYTSFQLAKKAGAQEPVYTSDYYASGDSLEYATEAENDYAEPELRFRPSRLVIQNNYYDYGRYIRKVKYVYINDPWFDPAAGDYYWDEPDIFVSINIGWNDPYWRWNPFWYPVFYPVYAGPVWWPQVVYDPWWCGPVYNPLPWYPQPPVVISRPVIIGGPIIIDEPAYDPPPVTDNPIRHGKRDWDRRQPTDRRRIVRDGSRGTTTIAARKNTNRRRVIADGKRNNNSGRIIRAGKRRVAGQRDQVNRKEKDVRHDIAQRSRRQPERVVRPQRKKAVVQDRPRHTSSTDARKRVMVNSRRKSPNAALVLRNRPVAEKRVSRTAGTGSRQLQSAARSRTTVNRSSVGASQRQQIKEKRVNRNHRSSAYQAKSSRSSSRSSRTNYSSRSNRSSRKSQPAYRSSGSHRAQTKVYRPVKSSSSHSRSGRGSKKSSGTRRTKRVRR